MRRRKVDPFIANKSELQASAHKYHSLSQVLFYCSWWKLLHLFISSEEIRLWKSQLTPSEYADLPLVLNFLLDIYTSCMKRLCLSINRPDTDRDTHFIIRVHSQKLSFFSFLNSLSCSRSSTTSSYSSLSANQSNFFNDIASCFALSL